MPTLPPEGRKDRRVHTDNLTIEVEGWSTGIALVDRGINLNEIVIGAGTEVTTTGRYDARCNRSAQTERIANRNPPTRRCGSFLSEKET